MTIPANDDFPIKVLIREAIAKDLINSEIPKFCFYDSQAHIIKPALKSLRELYKTCLTGADAEAEVILGLSDHPRLKLIGATRYDIIVWWTKLKISGELDRYENPNLCP